MLPPGGANRKALSSNCEYLSGPLGVGTLIEEVPHPSMNVPECVSRSLNHLQSCATPRSKALAYPPVNSRVAAEVEGVSLIDPTPTVCLEKTCPAVIGDVLIYRNGAHLTATYVRTLTPWLAKQLPEPAD